MMAAFAIIPLLAMVGGAVDASRTYMAYTRLQQACDSGALAGRKAMANVTTLSDTEKAKANEFFDFNFPANTYSAQSVVRSFSKGADGVVIGTASLSMPTTLMKMFGFAAIPLQVGCQATLNIPNTDVMFVLDVTGSMAGTPAGYATSDPTQSRIYGLRQAVKDFYAVLGPGAKSGPGRIRYGFMPYSSNVNVGRILYAANPSFISGGANNNKVAYVTRKALTSNGKFSSWSYSSQDVSVSSIVRSSTFTMPNPAYWTGAWSSDDQNYDYWIAGPDWRGQYYWASSRTSASVTWEGCIQEAETVNNIVSTTALSPLPSTAYDMDIDLVPSSEDTRWKPFLPQIQYEPASSGSRGQWLGRSRGDYGACPAEARRLAQFSDMDATTKRSPSLESYIDTLQPSGFTYHDIGLVWGSRFLSPTGIFSADNSDAAAPGQYQVSRHIVFMTDGELRTVNNNNDAWGINIYDGHIAPTNATSARTDESHERRSQMICNAMKSKGFTIWVIGFGSDGLSDTLKKCASDDDHWSEASDTAALRKTFAKIAQTIGGLRLSQ